MFGPKLKNFSTCWIKDHSNISKAFSKFMNSNIPGSLHDSVNPLGHLKASRFGRYIILLGSPFDLSEPILAVLVLLFCDVSGKYFVVDIKQCYRPLKTVRLFSSFGINDIIPCLWDIDSLPVSKPSLKESMRFLHKSLKKVSEIFFVKPSSPGVLPSWKPFKAFNNSSFVRSCSSSLTSSWQSFGFCRFKLNKAKWSS